MEHLAIDLGTKESHICHRAASGEILDSQRLKTSSIRAYLTQVEAPARVLIETSAQSLAVADIAKELGHEVKLVPARFVRMFGVGHRGKKTDRTDAEELSRASTVTDLPSTWHRSHRSRDLMSLCTTRDQLIKTRTALTNHLKAECRRRLIPVPRGSVALIHRGIRWVLENDEDGLSMHLDTLINQLESLNETIAQVNQQLEDVAKADETCRLLMTTPGVGPVTALRFVSTVDDIERFPSAASVQAYLGLTPGENSSGERVRTTGVTKAGPRQTRWVLIQACWAMWRTRPNDPLVVWAKDLAERKNKPLAIVAMARKLAGALYAMWRDGKAYDASRPSKSRVESQMA